MGWLLCWWGSSGGYCRRVDQI